jgi:hypothetical protein
VPLPLRLAQILHGSETVLSVVRNLRQGVANPKTEKCDSCSMHKLHLPLNCVYCRFIMRRVPVSRFVLFFFPLTNF